MYHCFRGLLTKQQNQKTKQNKTKSCGLNPALYNSKISIFNQLITIFLQEFVPQAGSNVRFHLPKNPKIQKSKWDKKNTKNNPQTRTMILRS